MDRPAANASLGVVFVCNVGSVGVIGALIAQVWVNSRN